MAYFPHAFQKMLLAKNAVPIKDGSATVGSSYTDGNLTVNNTLAADDLLTGQLGIVHGITNRVIDLDDTPTYATVNMFYLAQGSLYTNDKVGKFHGGYKETVKSKGINPKYISDFYKVISRVAQNAIVEVDSGLDCVSIECNTTYYLRIDVKGSPALRTLTHNAYLTAPAFSGCCDDDDANIDPNVINLGWMDYINDDPTMSEFVLATVWNDLNNVTASLTASETAGKVLTFSDDITAAGAAAGDIVEFTPSEGSLTTDSTVLVEGAYSITIGTMDGDGFFSVGQEVTSDVTGTLASGTKLIELISGDGGAASIFRTNYPVAGSDTVVLTSTDPVIAVVKTALTTDLTLYAADGLWDNTGTTDIVDFTTTAVAVKVWKSITTADYTVLTGAAADESQTKLVLVSAYVDTSFADCSFNPKDKYDVEPLQIYASVTDETGDPCATDCWTITEVQQAIQGKGFGETVLRDLILAKRYRQEDWKDDPRMREILGDTVVDDITRTGKYSCYYLLHSVPRKSNPTGTFDSDQYLIKIAFPDAQYVHANVAKFETWIETLLASAGNPLTCRVVM